MCVWLYFFCWLAGCFSPSISLCPVFLFACLSLCACLLAYLSLRLFVRMSVCLLLAVSACLLVCVASVSVPVNLCCLSVSLSACPFFLSVYSCDCISCNGCLCILCVAAWVLSAPLLSAFCVCFCLAVSIFLRLLVCVCIPFRLFLFRCMLSRYLFKIMCFNFLFFSRVFFFFFY